MKMPSGIALFVILSAAGDSAQLSPLRASDHHRFLVTAEPATVPVYSVAEITFTSPRQTAKDAPARDAQLAAAFRRQSGAPEITVQGFFGGDGAGDLEGDVFIVRFCPTRPGQWTMTKVASNAKAPDQRHQGIAGLCPADHFFEMPSALRKTIGGAIQESLLELALRGKPQALFSMVGRLNGVEEKGIRDLKEHLDQRSVQADSKSNSLSVISRRCDYGYMA